MIHIKQLVSEQLINDSKHALTYTKSKRKSQNHA